MAEKGLSLLFGFDVEIARWVGERCGVADFGLSRAIGVADGEKIIAGAVYSNFRNRNIEAAIASDDPRWCRRRSVLRGFFRYPFVQLGCRRITCIVPADNPRSLKLCLGLGFALEGRCRQVFGPVDGLICGMVAEECRWIK